MTTRLVCTAELDLPENALEASKASTGLLTIWEQFVGALPEQGLSHVRTKAAQVKSKPKSANKDDGEKIDSAAVGGDAPMPTFLRRDK
jgi:hypothetical protein